MEAVLIFSWIIHSKKDAVISHAVQLINLRWTVRELLCIFTELNRMRSNPNLYRAGFQPSGSVKFSWNWQCCYSFCTGVGSVQRVSSSVFMVATSSTELQHGKFVLMLHNLLSLSDLWLTVSYSWIILTN